VGGRKSPSPIDKAHGLYNSLYYRTSRDNYLGHETTYNAHVLLPPLPFIYPAYSAINALIYYVYYVPIIFQLVTSTQYFQIINNTSYYVI